MTKRARYYAIGLMSGTSLDGLDIAFSCFSLEKGQWAFEILQAETFPYDELWRDRLRNAPGLSAFELIQLDKYFGAYLGKKVKSFIRKYRVEPDLIASHGHTVFHQPDKRITFQIGSGENICAETGVTTITDFRSMDVALGGQGAPLVPVGDGILFPGYDYCLNLGGFSNISFVHQGERKAFDICPVNIVLNRLCPPYDTFGHAGRKGQLNPQLLEALSKLEYYSVEPPKSLGKEWLEKEFFPILDSFGLPLNNQLRTVYEHISSQIAVHARGSDKKLLVTGGGAKNTFLIELLKQKSEAGIIIPDGHVIDFKEALVFAFLGVLRVRGEVNVLSSVTGAERDSCSGVVCSAG